MYPIKEEFEKFVKSTFPNRDIQNFLINHEKLPLLIEKLTKELRGCDSIILRSQNKDLFQKRKTVKDLIVDFSRFFCNTALNEKLKEVANGNDFETRTSNKI